MSVLINSRVNGWSLYNNGSYPTQKAVMPTSNTDYNNRVLPTLYFSLMFWGLIMMSTNEVFFNPQNLFMFIHSPQV